MSAPYYPDNKGPGPQVNYGANPPYAGQPGYAGQPPPVVYQQPQAGHTTVVVQQPGVIGKPPRDWGSGICDCCDDVGICLCGTFCGLCMAFQLSMDMQEACILPCIMPNWLSALRVKMRMQENIQGSILSDCCMETWCGACAMCQLAREIKTVRSQQNFNLTRQ